jgi:hypothetical protein
VFTLFPFSSFIWLHWRCFCFFTLFGFFFYFFFAALSHFLCLLNSSRSLLTTWRYCNVFLASCDPFKRSSDLLTILDITGLFYGIKHCLGLLMLLNSWFFTIIGDSCFGANRNAWFLDAFSLFHTLRRPLCLKPFKHVLHVSTFLCGSDTAYRLLFYFQNILAFFGSFIYRL